MTVLYPPKQVGALVDRAPLDPRLGNLVPGLKENVYKVVRQKSISVQICRLMICVSNNTGSVDGFVREGTFAK